MNGFAVFATGCKLGSLHRSAAAAAAAAAPRQLLSPGFLPVLAEPPLSSLHKQRTAQGRRALCRPGALAQADGWAEAEDAAAWKQMRASCEEEAVAQGAMWCSDQTQSSGLWTSHKLQLVCFKVCFPFSIIELLL